MAVYIGHDECRVIYVARNGQQRRVSSIWVGDQQVFPPAGRQEVHVFTRGTQGFGRVDNGTHFAFTVPVPWWATNIDVVLLGAGEKGSDGTKSVFGGNDGAGGKSGAWVVKTVALPQSENAVVRVGKGTSTAPHATEMILPGVGGQADVRVHDGEGTRTAHGGSTGSTPSPQSRTEYGQTHTGGAGGTRNNPGNHPGGGGGGGQGAGSFGTATKGQPGGDGYVWLRFRSDAPIGSGFTLYIGVPSGDAYHSLRDWAASIGETYQTITEITVPVEVVGPSLQSLFNDCRALASAPDMDTSQVTNMGYMFYGCSSLTSIPELDTSQVIDAGFMFANCSSLTSVPDLNTSQVTNMQSTFSSCSSLTTIPPLDTSQVMNMQATFSYCQALTSIPGLDSGRVNDVGYAFYGCSSLESVTLPGMGNGFTTTQTLDMGATKLNTAAANALMQSLGTVPAAANGTTLQLPSTAAGADTSIATAKNWTVTIG